MLAKLLFYRQKLDFATHRRPEGVDDGEAEEQEARGEPHEDEAGPKGRPDVPGRQPADDLRQEPDQEPGAAAAALGRNVSGSHHRGSSLPAPSGRRTPPPGSPSRRPACWRVPGSGCPRPPERRTPRPAARRILPDMLVRLAQEAAGAIVHPDACPMGRMPLDFRVRIGRGDGRSNSANDAG